MPKVVPRDVDMTAPGSKLKYRVTYPSGNQKWVRERPGHKSKKWKVREKRRLLRDPKIREFLRKMEVAVMAYLDDESKEDGMKQVVRDLELKMGWNKARMITRRLYKVQKVKLHKMEKAKQDVERQKRIVDAIKIAVKYSGRRRRDKPRMSFDMAQKDLRIADRVAAVGPDSEEWKIIHEALQDFIKSTDERWNYITPVELEKMDKSDLFLLDVRKPEDFEQGHIEGASNIFWMDLLKPENLAKLPKDKKIVLLCYVGHTSSQALVALRLLGYDAVSLKFGMGKSPVEGVPVAGWLDYGFETVKGKTANNSLIFWPKMKDSNMKIRRGTGTIIAKALAGADATTEYKAKSHEVQELLSDLDKALTKHAKEQATDPMSWGFAGDLGYLIKELQEAIRIID